MMPYGDINNGSGNGLLPDSIKPIDFLPNADFLLIVRLTMIFPSNEQPKQCLIAHKCMS